MIAGLFFTGIIESGATAAITTQPKDSSVKDGDDASFSVAASGTGLQYQWYVHQPRSTHGFVTIAALGAAFGATYTGDTGPQFTIFDADMNTMDGYVFYCLVTEPAGGGVPVTSTAQSNNVTLSVTGIASQSTKFYGAAYANFTGIQDDNPSGYAQVHVRLSQPLNTIRGIDYDASNRERFIGLRNFLFQLTYANTDNFKLYSFEKWEQHYVNRLDLLAHAYFNGNLGLNLFTYVMPKEWAGKHKGDLGHIYFDVMTSLLLTDVYDTLHSRQYNVKTNLWGLNAKAILQDVGASRFTIEAGGKLMWLFPSSNSVNSNLSPQISNVGDLDLNPSLNLEIQNKNVIPYFEFGAVVEYATGKVKESAEAKDNSHIFIRYSYTSNYIKNTAPNFRNNYFQFQIGYVFDISKFFYGQ